MKWIGPSAAASPRRRVVCLCAQWCNTCREYRVAFEKLATERPDEAFGWLDIEEQAEIVDDLDIENFPTLLVLRDERLEFFGTMLPQIGQLARMLAAFDDAAPAVPEVDDEVHAMIERLRHTPTAS